MMAGGWRVPREGTAAQAEKARCAAADTPAKPENQLMSDAPKNFPYDTRLDERLKPLEVVVVPALVAVCPYPGYNQTLCRVMVSGGRLDVLRGEYNWQKH